MAVTLTRVQLFDASVPGKIHMPGRDIIVIGFSAEGVVALARLGSGVLGDLAASGELAATLPALEEKAELSRRLAERT